MGPYLPIGAYGPYPERLRQQFEGVIWRFRTGGQWREIPQELRAWSTVHNRFRQWSAAGVFEALLEGLITEATKRGEVDLPLVGIDSTIARAHHDAAGMRLGHDVVTALEKAAAEEKIRPGLHGRWSRTSPTRSSGPSRGCWWTNTRTRRSPGGWAASAGPSPRT